jgi:hypothetical protein
MNKLLLALGVLIGLVSLNSPSYALRAGDTTNKTLYNSPLISSITNGNTAFVTASVGTGAVQVCTATSIGSGNTNGTLMSCGSTPITGISLSGGGSGGTVTLYDANTNQAFGNGTSAFTTNSSNQAESGPLEVVFEATVAANTQNYYDLSNAPINTVNGVVAMATSTSGAVVYSSKAIATNT